MNKALHLLALSLLLAFPCLAQEKAEEKEAAEEKVEMVKATQPGMMKVENPRLFLDGEDDHTYLKLRATLKNISDKAIEIDISNDKRPPENGKPLHVLSEPVLWFYQKSDYGDGWDMMGLGGSFGATPTLILGAGESMAFEATYPLVLSPEYFNEERKESYRTHGVRFFIYAAVVGEARGIIVEGRCKWEAPR